MKALLLLAGLLLTWENGRTLGDTISDKELQGKPPACPMRTSPQASRVEDHSPPAWDLMSSSWTPPQPLLPASGPGLSVIRVASQHFQVYPKPFLAAASRRCIPLLSLSQASQPDIHTLVEVCEAWTALAFGHLPFWSFHRLTTCILQLCT